MKWLKHETDAMDSEKLKMLIHEFGFEGYGWFWRIMEIVGKKMDETGRCHYEQPVSEWCGNLKVKQRKLRLFLELNQLQSSFKVVYSDNKLRIEVPNLLKKRDNYSKYYKDSAKKKIISISPEVEVEVEVEVDTNKYVKKPKKKKASVEKKPSTPTYEAEQFWISEFVKNHGSSPDMNPAKDRKILKDLIARHGVEEVMRKIPIHIDSGSLLTIGGFKTKFNDLGITKKKSFETFEERHERELVEMRERINASHA